MGEYVASQVVKCMIQKGICIKGANILVLGITFKENCPDVRNTKVVDVIRSLEEYGTAVTVHDPWANPEEVVHEYNIESIKDFSAILNNKYDAVILSVSHNDFLDLDINSLLNGNGIVYDVKGILKEKADSRL